MIIVAVGPAIENDIAKVVADEAFGGARERLRLRRGGLRKITRFDVCSQRLAGSAVPRYRRGIAKA